MVRRLSQRSSTELVAKVTVAFGDPGVAEAVAGLERADDAAAVGAAWNDMLIGMTRTIGHHDDALLDALACRLVADAERAGERPAVVAALQALLEVLIDCDPYGFDQRAAIQSYLEARRSP